MAKKNLEQNAIQEKKLTDESFEVLSVNIDKNPSALGKIVSFYNKHFPDSQHSKAYKEKMYRNQARHPIILTIQDQGEIVGLLEGYDDKQKPNHTALATLAVASGYRGKGLAKKLFERFKQATISRGSQEAIILHFRDGKKEQLNQLYQKFGFSNLIQSGTYTNGEVKWEMSISLID